MTKAEFVSKANAICKQGNAKTRAAGNKFNKDSQAKVIKAIKTVLLPSIQDQIDRIRALGVPAGGQATVPHMLDVAQADLDKVKAQPQLLFGNTAFASFAKLAHPYGLTECAANSK